MPENDPADQPRREHRTALLLVGICALLNIISRGLGESFTAFLLPLSNAFSADRASVAAVYSLLMLTTGGSSVLAGYLFDRFGPLRVYMGSMVLMAASLLLAAAAQQLWHLYLCIGIAFGVAAAGLGNAPHSGLLARWFEGPGLPRAMSVVHAGMGAGTLVMVPLSQLLIELFGWRLAYIGLAAAVVLSAPLLATIDWRLATSGRKAWNAPRELPSGQDLPFAGEEWTVRSAMATRAFWGLTSVYAFTGAGMFSVMVQGVAYLVELGYPPLQAASIYGVVGMLTPIGMIGFAWLDGRIGRHRSVGLSYFFSLAGLLALYALQFTPHPALLALFVFGVGISFGARGPMVGSTAAQLFRGRRLGNIIGTLMLGSGIGVSAGTYLGAKLHDMTGGYDAVFAFSGLCVLLGAMPFWTYRALRGSPS